MLAIQFDTGITDFHVMNQNAVHATGSNPLTMRVKSSITIRSEPKQ